MLGEHNIIFKFIRVLLLRQFILRQVYSFSTKDAVSTTSKYNESDKHLQLSFSSPEVNLTLGSLLYSHVCQLKSLSRDCSFYECILYASI